MTVHQLKTKNIDLRKRREIQIFGIILNFIQNPQRDFQHGRKKRVFKSGEVKWGPSRGLPGSCRLGQPRLFVVTVDICHGAPASSHIVEAHAT